MMNYLRKKQLIYMAKFSFLFHECDIIKLKKTRIDFLISRYF